jgi:alkylation response protein AidB-like acyl-CoA dehydrogenase
VTALAEFHDELRTVARALLAPTSPLVTGGEPADADWSQLAQAGWLGLDVPEEHGGAGASFAEVAVVLEELGRAATASPVLGAVLAVGALGLVDPSPLRDELLAAVAAGEVTAAVALPTGDLDGGIRARPTGVADSGTGAPPTSRPGSAGAPLFRLDRADGAARLVGRAPFVPDAPGAARLLVVASNASSGPVLVDVAPGDVELRPTPVVDATRSLGEVVADGAPVDGDRCWPMIGDPRDLYLRGAAAVALDSLGIAQAALDATVAYAADRHQFGRPIGSFQAVKHACADVAVELAVARRLVTGAVDQLVAGAPEAGVAVAMAKAHAVETGVAATGSALQLHGGIGYTWEHGLHVLLKRATLNRSLFGSPAAHRGRLAQRYAPTPTG